MNKKRFFIAFIVIFILLEATNYLINNIILASTYEQYKSIFRPMDDMMSKMWIIWVTDVVWSFFFVFFFVKGYENKGIGEGIRYGVYIGIFFGFVISYQNYVVYPVAYPLALQWFIYALIQALVLGIITSLIYKPRSIEMAAEAK
jgi:hypothetical protein